MITVAVPFSGGKDSQATVLYAKERYGNISIIFCDTGWEDEETYDHINYFMEAIGGDLITLKSKEYTDFVDLAEKKGRFPSSTVGFCTEELKIKPMIDWILEQKTHLLILQGIRASESDKRSKMLPGLFRFFKYYFEPYKSNKKTIEKYKNNPPKTFAQKRELNKAYERLKNGYLDEKYFTYRKEEVFDWCKKYDDSVIRPFFYASPEDVIFFSENRGFRVHPWYYLGAYRIGCAPCKNLNLQEAQFLIKHKPHVLVKAANAELRVGRTFFSPDKIPERYRTGFDEKSGTKLTTINDFVRYVEDKNAQLNMADDLFQKSCESVFKICE